MDEIPFRAPRPLKQETVAHVDRLSAQIRVYALALLLATAISALHACILFGLADFFTLFKEWAKTALPSSLGRRTFSSLSRPFPPFLPPTSRKRRSGRSFSGNRVNWGRLATDGISPVLRTRRSATATWCFRNRGGAWVPSARSMACTPLDVQRFSFYCCKASGSARFDQMPLQHTES